LNTDAFETEPAESKQKKFGEKEQPFASNIKGKRDDFLKKRLLNLKLRLMNLRRRLEK
jgi:hypothetical protein